VAGRTTLQTDGGWQPSRGGRFDLTNTQMFGTLEVLCVTRGDRFPRG